MNWYVEVLKKYAEFSGRARRTEFWMFALFNVLIAIGLGVVDGVIGSPGILGMLYGLGVLIPGLAVSIRRLHDTNRSGWWLLIALVPLIGAIALLIFYVQEGDAGSNQFGSNPKRSG